MAVDIQTRNIGSSTANGRVDILSLIQEINDKAELTTAMVGGSYVEIVDGDVSIHFKDTLTPPEVTALDEVLLAHQGITAPEIVPVQEVHLAGVNIVEGRLDTATFPPSTSRVNVFTHDFTDRTTWFTMSERVDNHVMIRNTEEGDRFYDLDREALGLGDEKVAIIDVSHAKIFAEDLLTRPDGGSYAPVVMVDGVVQRERTLNAPENYDFHMEYDDFTGPTSDASRVAGRIAFRKSPPEDAVVTISFCKATTSEFFVRPLPGKKLKLSSVEIQFSVNVSVRDSMVFQPYGLLGGLTPEEQTMLVFYLQSIGQIPPGYTPPPETVVPYGSPTRYKSMRDFINEANGNYPVIPPSSAPKAELTPRDLRYGIVTYPWNYQSVIELESSRGMFVSIKLDQDEPYYGEFGTATFYCYSENET